MEQNDKIQLFEDKRIRTAWDEEKEEWFFSVVDVIAILTDQPSQRGASNYWAKLKQRLKEEGANQLLTSCQQLKLKSPKDGKRYLTDVADTEQLLRIIQSIPSPKAEPFKMWLAQVGRERIEETIDPELTIDRALETYQKKGYSREWINQRLQAIQVRKELTDEWDARGVQQGIEYAILTDEISRAWSGMTTRQYKRLKGLKKENLRDNMTTLELVLNMLAEATTTELSKEHQPETFIENRLFTEIDNFEKYGVQYFPFYLLETKELIGCCGLRPYKNQNDVYELGFHLRKKYWHKGYALEAAKAMIDYAFTELKAVELKAGHNPNNIASSKVLSKLGFQYEYDEYYEPTGLNHPLYRYPR